MTVLYSDDYAYQIADAMRKYADYDFQADEVERIAQNTAEKRYSDFMDAAKNVRCNLIAFGDLVRWNGRRFAFMDGKRNLAEMIDALMSNDYTATNTFYIDDDGDLVWEAKGHDNPVAPHHMKIRIIKEEHEDDDFCDKEEEDFMKCTECLGRWLPYAV